MTEKLRHIIQSLPQLPGVYRYFNNTGQLLYVGKAKNLKNRVTSYFSGKQANRKTIELVSRIENIEFTIVQSEADALLLENTLIKQHKPVFNIELKDDKTYPFIVIKKEPFPRVFLTRKKINDGSTYLGPFTSVGKVRALMEFIRQYLPIRTCKLNLSDRNIKSGKYKVCLEFQLGNCKGPCEGLQSMEDYMSHIHQIKNILNGNIRQVLRFLRNEMDIMASELKFEKAAILKNKITLLENYQANSTVVSAKALDADVFYFLRDQEKAFINYLMVRNGIVLESDNTELSVKIEEDDKEVLATLINNIRQILNSHAKEIIIPFAIEWVQEDIKISIPKAGPKLQLLELSKLNAQHCLKEYQKKKILQLNNNKTAENILEKIRDTLHLSSLPEHIECFDNSNLHGTYPVSAMVCFKNGIASKKDYRKFNVKTVLGIDDFATMKEVVHRRYAALLERKEPLPQLVIIDGGKGQLNAALESINALDLKNKITLIGLAKNIEEIFFVGDKHSLKLPFDNPVLLFIRKIRDEVHRFGIEFHRNKRSTGLLQNELHNIQGIGEKTVEVLLKHFRSVKSIESADAEELEKVAGIKKAAIIRDYFKKKGAG